MVNFDPNLFKKNRTYSPENVIIFNPEVRFVSETKQELLTITGNDRLQGMIISPSGSS